MSSYRFLLFPLLFVIIPSTNDFAMSLFLCWLHMSPLRRAVWHRHRHFSLRPAGFALGRAQGCCKQAAWIQPQTSTTALWHTQLGTKHGAEPGVYMPDGVCMRPHGGCWTCSVAARSSWWHCVCCQWGRSLGKSSLVGVSSAWQGLSDPERSPTTHRTFNEHSNDSWSRGTATPSIQPGCFVEVEGLGQVLPLLLPGHESSCSLGEFFS